MSGLPSPWLVAPDLAPRLMDKLEALGQEITTIGDDIDPWADKLLESIRECVESIEDPSVTMQPIRDMLERAYQARDEMIKLLGGEGGDVSKSKSAPSKEMIVAYRLKFILGAKTQKEIAAKLSQEFGRRINQGTVSNWLRDVEAWIKAGNVLPDIPGLTGEPPSIDPRVIGMGARRDGLTPRQRAKRKEMDNEK